MTELFINNTAIDLFDDVPYPLNYAIADIRDPDKRDTSYSKTINIPGSKANNILFGHLFEVEVSVNSSGTTNFNPSFNPNLKAACVFYVDRIEVFRGFVQLLKINVLDNYEVTYDISMFGKLGDIYAKIGDAKLDDGSIDLSAYDHVYNRSNITTSWSATVGQGYVYPMIDLGLNDTINWRVTHFFPGIYLKQYIDKIFTYAGYTYTSDFFTSNFFKRLFMPFNSDKFKLSDAQIANREFRASQTSNQNNELLGLGTSYVWQFNNEISDPGGVYNPSTYKFTAINAGHYSFHTYLVNSLTGSVPASGVSVWAEIIKNSGGVLTILNSNQLLQIPLSLNVSSVYLNAGDQIYVRLRGSNAPGAYLTTQSTSTFTGKVSDPQYSEGETVQMNNAIPKDIKHRDLLTSTLKMFNLYVEEDRSSTNNLLINPRNDFYNTSGTTTIDWTPKLDISQPVVIEPMGALDSRRYVYTWDYDEDYYNKYYKTKYNRVYGDRIIDIDNDFVTATKELKVIWASTVPVGQTFTDRVIPTIVTVDDNGIKKQKVGKIRLLYWAGLKSCIPNWNFISSTSTTSESQYPNSGHFDDPYTSTVDLNFGVVSEILYSAATIVMTNNNVYNKYHKDFLESITNKDSKIVTAKFYLTPADILKLDFRNLFFVDGNYYRLNKIKDYDPTTDGLTSVELLKIDE